MRIVAAVSLIAVAGMAAGCSNQADFRLLDPSAYSSFVANWEPEEAPLCAAFASKADWDTVMHPAAGMGAKREFAPPDATWTDHAVLLLSRVVGSVGEPKTFVVNGVTRTDDAIDVAYTFTPPADSSATFKDFFLVEVAAPLPGAITFTENGKVVCTTKPGASSPAIQAGE